MKVNWAFIASKMGIHVLFDFTTDNWLYDFDYLQELTYPLVCERQQLCTDCAYVYVVCLYLLWFRPTFSVGRTLFFREGQQLA
jgi:hypothetical protein